MINYDELQKEFDTYEEIKEVPDGEYICKVDKIERKENNGKKQVTVQLDIVDGDFKGSKLFINQMYAGTKNDAFSLKMLYFLLDNLVLMTTIPKDVKILLNDMQLQQIIDNVKVEIATSNYKYCVNSITKNNFKQNKLCEIIRSKERLPFD